MVTLYILKSESTGKFYIGSTVDLPRRLSEHARHHGPYTRERGPWALVDQEELETLSGARSPSRLNR